MSQQPHGQPDDVTGHDRSRVALHEARKVQQEDPEDMDAALHALERLHAEMREQLADLGERDSGPVGRGS